MYNIKNFKKYLEDNKTKLIDIINENNKDNICDWTHLIKNDDNIFNYQIYLFKNFLNWCCTK